MEGLIKGAHIWRPGYEMSLDDRDARFKVNVPAVKVCWVGSDEFVDYGSESVGFWTSFTRHIKYQH